MLPSRIKAKRRFAASTPLRYCCCSGRPNNLLLQWNDDDVKGLFTLAFPTIVVQLSFVVPPFLAASYIGRTFGPVAMDGYTLAWGTGNLSTLAMLQGVFNACDTLAPRAYGAQQYRQVGVVAIQGYVASLLIFSVNTIVVIFMDKILKLLDQDSEVSSFACDFYPLYALSFPFYALYEVLWKFLSAQNTLIPMVVSTLVCISIILPPSLSLSIYFFGFKGGALGIVLFYCFDCLIVIFWLRYFEPHNKQTWPGLETFGEALRWKPFMAFLALGTGGMLAYMEWVYWEVLTVIIGTFGVMPLSAHTIPRQFTDIGNVVPLGIAIALAIRVGSNLSKGDATAAKALTLKTYALSVAVFGIASVFMYFYRDLIVSLFTVEIPVIQECNEIWFHSCLYFFLFCLFGINSGIAVGLGMQFLFGIVTSICMWFIGMPTLYYFSVLKEGGLKAVWICIWPPYLIVNLYMGVVFVRKDWDEIAKQIQKQQQSDMIQNKKETDVESLRPELFPVSAGG